MSVKITGSGSYIPTKKILNSDFSNHRFLNEDGTNFRASNEIIAKKFVEITGIFNCARNAETLRTLKFCIAGNIIPNGTSGMVNLPWYSNPKLTIFCGVWFNTFCVQ